LTFLVYCKVEEQEEKKPDEEHVDALMLTKNAANRAENIN
jgi:hypothetical protein